MGLPKWTDINGKYVQDVGVRSDASARKDGDGNVIVPARTAVIYVRFKPDGMNKKVAGGGLVLIPTDEGGSISFTCLDTGANHGINCSPNCPDLTDYLPSTCKP